MSVARRTPSRIGIITLRSTMASDCSSFSIAQRLAACSGMSGVPRCAGSELDETATSAARAQTKRRGLAMGPMLKPKGPLRHLRHPPPLAPHQASYGETAPKRPAVAKASLSYRFRVEEAEMLQEFRAFIARGNVIDLAVAVIIGAAFGKIVTSLVE